MANTEDYLDSLLNSINNTNMSGKKSKSYSGSDPYDNASEAFRKFEREKEYKREQRKKREEEQRFLQEFEGELEQEDVDDFLRQFELELAEEEENEANESVNTQSSVDENAGNIANTKLNAICQSRGETRENRRREGFFLLNFEDIPRLRRKDPRYGVDTTKGL